MEKIKMAIDLGNGFIKYKSDKNELVIPSSRVYQENILVEDNELGNDINLYEIEDRKFYAGNKIADPTFITNPDDLKSSYSSSLHRYSYKNFQDLFLSSISDLLVDYIDEEREIYDVEVITGVPSGDLDDEIIRPFQEMADKTYIVRRNGEEFKFKINKGDLLIIGQPLGSLMLGKSLSKKAMPNSIVIDFGAGTTIIDTFAGMQRIPDKSLTINKGLKTIYASMLKDLNDNSLNINDIENAIKNKCDIEFGRKIIAFNELNELFESKFVSFFENEILQKIHEYSSDRTNIFITGGGSILAKETGIDKKFSIEGEWLSEPQMANVRGYAIYHNLVGGE